MYNVVGSYSPTVFITVGPFESRNNAELAAVNMASNPKLESIEILSDESSDDDDES